MGQASNSGRNSSLDDQKQRAAGRQEQNNPQQRAIDDAVTPDYAKGKTGGAFGKEGAPNTNLGKGGLFTEGAGGGGGNTTTTQPIPAEMPRSDQPTRKNNA